MKYLKSLLPIIFSLMLTANVATAAKRGRAHRRAAHTTKVVKAEKPTDIAAATVGKVAVLEIMKQAEPQSIVPDMISYAKRHLGSRYRSGGKGPKAFDCSGFTSYVFREFGYKLGASSRDQYTQGSAVAPDEVQPGDLVFFSGRAAGKTVGHVGMVIDVDPETQAIRFIHASNSGGVKVDTYPDGGYYSRRYIGAKRVLTASDLGEM